MAVGQQQGKGYGEPLLCRLDNPRSFSISSYYHSCELVRRPNGGRVSIPTGPGMTLKNVLFFFVFFFNGMRFRFSVPLILRRVSKYFIAVLCVLESSQGTCFVSLSLSLSTLLLFGLLTVLSRRVAGCLLDGAPPDVPPRNVAMSRMNGRSGSHMGHVGNTLPHMSSLGGTLGGTHHGTLPNMANMTNLGGQDGDADFEPSCLVRTPSGNVYIPTGESPGRLAPTQ